MAELMRVYTLEELVSLLKVTKRTLYNYIREGKLKAVKTGKYWRVTQKQLEDFLSEGGGREKALTALEERIRQLNREELEQLNAFLDTLPYSPKAGGT